MWNDIVAIYIYGVACLVGGFTVGLMWRAYKDEDGNGV